MFSNILFVLDASGSMNESFYEEGKPSKFDAVREAFQIFCERHAKLKGSGFADRVRLGLVSYKTEGLALERVELKEVYPMSFFPPAPNPKRLKEFGPFGNSPLFEAIKDASSSLSNVPGNKRILAIITGDSKSNSLMNLENLKRVLVPAMQKSSISVALLQVGNADKNEGFDQLVQSLQPVMIQDLRLKPEIATTIEGIDGWLEGLFSSATAPSK